MSYRIVSYYTENTPYEAEAKRLQASLSNWEVLTHIAPGRNYGSWEKNCQYKARFILECLEQFSDDIVWVDADAEVLREPILFETLDADVAYHYLEHREELLSGTVFFKNNKETRAMIERWIALNDTNMEWDQRNLQEVLRRDKQLRQAILPAEYCAIYRHRVQKVEEPVIQHYQASRRHKRTINRGHRFR